MNFAGALYPILILAAKLQKKNQKCKRKVKIFAKKEEKNEKFIEREGDGGKLREKLRKNDRGSGVQIESARNRRRKSLIEIARLEHLQIGITDTEHRTPNQQS